MHRHVVQRRLVAAALLAGLATITVACDGEVAETSGEPRDKKADEKKPSPNATGSQRVQPAGAKPADEGPKTGADLCKLVSRDDAKAALGMDLDRDPEPAASTCTYWGKDWSLKMSNDVGFGPGTEKKSGAALADAIGPLLKMNNEPFEHFGGNFTFLVKNEQPLVLLVDGPRVIRIEPLMGTMPEKQKLEAALVAFGKEAWSEL